MPGKTAPLAPWQRGTTGRRHTTYTRREAGLSAAGTRPALEAGSQVLLAAAVRRWHGGEMRDRLTGYEAQNSENWQVEPVTIVFSQSGRGCSRSGEWRGSTVTCGATAPSPTSLPFPPVRALLQSQHSISRSSRYPILTIHTMVRERWASDCAVQGDGSTLEEGAI